VLLTLDFHIIKCLRFVFNPDIEPKLFIDGIQRCDKSLVGLMTTPSFIMPPLQQKRVTDSPGGIRHLDFPIDRVL